MALHTPDMVFHLHDRQDPVHGREAFAGFFALVPDLGWEQRSQIVGDDYWVVQRRMPGNRVYGMKVDVDFVDIIMPVKSKQSYTDSITLQAQLEVAEVPAWPSS